MPSDFERPLDKRGMRDAPIMAARLKDLGVRPQRLITSSAVRATTTADAFVHTFNVVKEEIDKLYHAPPETYLDVLSGLEETVSVVLIFGHNPGMTEICHLLGQKNVDNIPTCGMMVTEYHGTWQDIDWNKIQFQNMLFPKDPV